MELRADLILANRAYLDHSQPPGSPDAGEEDSSGGLLAAVRPVIEPWHDGRGTTWIAAGRGQHDRAWTDARGFELIPAARGDLRHRRLFFDDATWDAHYSAFANGFLWPLLHLVRVGLPDATAYYPRPVTPGPEAWLAAQQVASAFADAALEETGTRTCWVQDYQLALVPALLRERGYPGRIGFFLHTPFPSLEVARPYLDSRGRGIFREWVEGILGAAVVGLQTEADAVRFRQAAVALADAEEAADGSLRVDGRDVCISVHPVGMDAAEVADLAASARMPGRVAALCQPGDPLVLGLERADYTKGIPERLGAIARAYRAGVRFTYAGIAAPTREGVTAYAAIEAAVEEAVREAAEAAREAGCGFVHLRESLSWPEVIALQREANVIFTSSLADGMNLVPLQAAVAQSVRPAAERAVLIAGRDAGVASAYSEFIGAGLVAVDPLDADALLKALCDAVDGRPARISDAFVQAVRERDAARWANGFLTDLERNTC
jgi:trehalose-6-phosphate synthase